MKKEQSRVQDVYQNIQTWLSETSDKEVRSIVELIEQAKSILIAAEQIPEQQVKQFISNLKYDLSDFYQQYQADIKHSVYLDILNESLWDNLAKITDKSQVEWSELMDISSIKMATMLVILLVLVNYNVKHANIALHTATPI